MEGDARQRNWETEGTEGADRVPYSPESSPHLKPGSEQEEGPGGWGLGVPSISLLPDLGDHWVSLVHH